MFNFLVTFDGTAWETDQLMRMDATRFGEHSGEESAIISTKKPRSLKLLEKLPTLLMYESGAESPNLDLVRYGKIHAILVSGVNIKFRFAQEGQFTRDIIEEFAERLDIDRWERNRTHWAVKDGGIPKAMMKKILPYYDVVFSFAGEDRAYVEKVAAYLRSKGVSVFYDTFEQSNLWGKNLVEHFDFIYRKSAEYCVPFISKAYVNKMWTKLERRSALARAFEKREEYILPARFDDTDVPGIPPIVGHQNLDHISPTKFGKLILEKLGRT